MPQLSKKYLPLLILFLFSVPLFFINIQTVHPWGDDFAQYIKEAQNISQGRPFYQSGYIFNKYNPVYAPPQYPPGFPLLLAPVVKFLGLSFRAMCCFNSFIAACLLFALFAFFRKQAGVVASVCLAVLITYSGFMINIKASVLADTSCLLFITLYLTLRRSDTWPRKRIAWLVVFAAMAILIRSQAVFLLVAEGLFLFLSFIISSVKERTVRVKNMLRPPSLYVIAGVLTFSLFLNKVVFPTPVSTAVFYSNFIQDALKGNVYIAIKGYTGYLLKTISGFFYYETYNSFFDAAIYFIQGMGLVFGITGFLISISKRIAFDDVFFFIMCIVIICYPVRDPRYFLPAVPILFYYCYATLKVLLAALPGLNPRMAAVLLTAIYLCVGFSYLKKSTKNAPAGCIPQQKDQVAFQYITQHVGNHDIIVFTKPRALTLFTGKRCMNVAWQITPEMNKKIFDSLQVKYMLVLDGLDDGYFKTYLNKVQHPLDSVRISEGYTLYSLR